MASAISIICVKEFWRSSEVVFSSGCTKESDTVQMQSAFFPALAALQ